MKKRMLLPVALSALLLSGMSLATQEYYEVSGLSSDKLLSVRMAPDADAPIISALPHDASPVAIVRTDNGWGMFPAGEFSGWVAMSFLSPINQPMIGDTQLPDGMTCTGVEPFWVATLDGSGVTFSHQDWERSRSYGLDTATSSTDANQVSEIVFENGVATISPGQCFDGMSDAEFGWNGVFNLGGPDEAVMRGCCKLPAPLVDGDPPGYDYEG